MQDGSDMEVFTPELLDLLTRLALSTGSSLEDLLSAVHGTVGVSKTRQVSDLSPSPAGDNLLSIGLTENRGPVRLETPLYSVSNVDESLESLDTAVGRHASPKKDDYMRRFESAPAFVPRGSYMNGTPTTLMVKNIPNRVTREDFAGEIMSKMPIGSFDFVYLPIDFKTRSGFGYAFINMTSDVNVDLFVANLHKRRLACADGIYSKPLEVTVARVQGFTANINRLISSPVLFQADEDSHPLIFNSNQVSIPFKALMQLNRASVVFQTRPSIDDLIAMVEAAEVTDDN
jgi:hypothetical protein